MIVGCSGGRMGCTVRGLVGGSSAFTETLPRMSVTSPAPQGPAHAIVEAGANWPGR